MVNHKDSLTNIIPTITNRPNLSLAQLSFNLERSLIPHPFCTWNIPERPGDAIIIGVDNAGSGAHDTASVAHFAFARAKTLRLDHFLHIRPGFEAAKESDSIFGLLKRLDFIVDDLDGRSRIGE